MATGALSGGVCYESLSLATDAYFSALLPVSYIKSTGAYTTVEHVYNAGVWKHYSYTTSSTGVVTTDYLIVATPPVFPACYSPSEAFADGVNIGWAFAACMVIIVFVMTGKRLIHA